MVIYVLLALFVLLPAAAVLAAWKAGLRSPWILVAVGGLGGVLPGAWLGAAASAMASAVTTQRGLLRGGVFGFGVGLLAGALTVLALFLVARGRSR
jgi:hypothetical protein